MHFSYQAVDNTTGTVHVWTSALPDPEGAGYPGPNSPTCILQTNNPLEDLVVPETLEYQTLAAARLSGALADGTFCRIVEGCKEFRYSATSGAGWEDDGDTILRPVHVELGENGRFFSTRASEHAATFAAFRAMKGLLGRAKHVHVESHTTFGDGGGGIFDIKPVGAYVDNNGTVLVNGTAAGVRRIGLGDPANVDWFGPDKTGAVDTSAAFLAALAVRDHIIAGDDGRYLLTNTVWSTRDGVTVDLGKSTIVNGGLSFCFAFGSGSDTYTCENIKLRGGVFEQIDPDTAENRNFIWMVSVRKFEISDTTMNNVSDCGIQISCGCSDGVLTRIRVDGKTAYPEGESIYPVGRAILISGSNATDYVANFIDTATITRNASPFPTHGPTNITVRDCVLSDIRYGVYCINARNCTVDNCDIDIANSSGRCVAANAYSPGLRVTKCTLRSQATGTGVLVGQCSTGVLVSDNTFVGSFGIWRAVFVAGLARAIITKNVFLDATKQNVQIAEGGFAIVDGNIFSRSVRTNGDRAVSLAALDVPQIAGGLGTSATVVEGGAVVTNNVLTGLGIALAIENHHEAANGNQPSTAIAKVAKNTFTDINLATVEEYPVTLRAGSGAHRTAIDYAGSDLYPSTESAKDVVMVEEGTAYLLGTSIAEIAKYDVSVPASGGAITVTKTGGNNLGLMVTRSTDDLVLSARTQNAETGTFPAKPVPVMSVIDRDGGASVARVACVASGDDYQVTLYDSTGTVIPVSTAAVEISAIVGPSTHNSPYTRADYLAEIAMAVGGLSRVQVLCIGDDVVGTAGDDVSSFPAAIGLSLTAYSTGKAKIVDAAGRRSLLFSSAAPAVFRTNTPGGSGSTLVIAKYTGAVPAAGQALLSYGPTGGFGTIYVPSAGYTQWGNPSSMFVDYSPGYQLDNTMRTLTNSASIIGETQLGANGFDGSVWMYLQLKPGETITATQVHQAHAVNRRYWRNLGGTP